MFQSYANRARLSNSSDAQKFEAERGGDCWESEGAECAVEGDRKSGLSTEDMARNRNIRRRRRGLGRR